MRRFAHQVGAGSLAIFLVLVGNTIAPRTSLASPATPAAPGILTGQQEQVTISDDHTIRLLASASPAPPAFGSFQRFGFVIAPAQPLTPPAHTLRLDYTATVPDGSKVLLDVRGSADGVRWTDWETDLAPGAMASFHTPVRFAQYRVILLSNGQDPSVQNITLIPMHDRAIYTAAAEAEPPVAPTFRVHATRLGLVGWRTANGHRIQPRDHFVALPSRRALSSRGGNEYMVRITYQGRSAVAPVYDVGPWNTHDNYWDEQREMYRDLRRGWPEDHAAYFDGYNRGRAEKGRVSFPTAIDIADGVWWDELGIKGGRAEVEVTFLWLGTDPLAPAVANATPAPEAVPAPAAPPAAPSPAPPPDQSAGPGAPAAPPVDPPSAVPGPPTEQPVAPTAAAPPPTEAAPATASPTPSEAAGSEAMPTAAAPPASEQPALTPAAPAPPISTPSTAADSPPAAPALPTAAPAAAAAASDSENVVQATAVVTEATVQLALAPLTELVVDERDPAFAGEAAVKWYDGPEGCGNASGTLWTYSTPDARSSENIGRWQPQLAGAGTYDLFVFIPDCRGKQPNTRSAQYVVHYRDGTETIMVDQAAHAGTWVRLGRFAFAGGAAGFVELRDVTSDSLHTIWYDAVKWVPVP